MVSAALAGLLAVPAGAPLAADSDPAAFLGKEAPLFELPDAEGKTHDLADYRSGQGAVIIWVSTKCPVSNAYNDRMAALTREYRAKGFTFLGINSNRTEKLEEIAAHASENGLDFPVLKDERNVVADRYGASVTPEVYVLDAEGVLHYHGRIDDSMKESGVTTRDLEEVLDAMLAGKPVPKSESKAFGCTIKRVG
jgi:peroxiredoxin